MLIKKNAPWIWGDDQDKAFEQLTDSLVSDSVMAYFDTEKETLLEVDTSSYCLGAVLVQERKVISYASKALSDVESRYSETEREALAIL